MSRVVDYRPPVIRHVTGVLVPTASDPRHLVAPLKVAAVLDPAECFYATRVLFGAPLAHLPTWADCTWDLRAGGVSWRGDPLWICPDSVERLDGTHNLQFADLKTPMDWRFLVFRIVHGDACLTINHKKSVEVHVRVPENGQLPEGRLRVALRGVCQQDIR